MTYLSTWYLLTEEEKDEILASKYSWMIKNLLLFGNTLIAPKRINKKKTDKVKKDIEDALASFGYPAEISISAHKHDNDNETDFIATVEKWIKAKK